MSDKSDYIIIGASSVASLRDEVRHWLNLYYIPVGGLCVVGTNEFYQAMYKELS